MNRRVAFVTGASRGIGRACALSLAQSGARLVLAARDRARLEDVAKETGDGTLVVEMDQSEPDSIRDAFARAESDAGPIAILVNNAGITRDSLAMRMTHDQWHEVIETNLTGAFLCCQQALRNMIQQRWGRIINMTSVVGEAGNAGQANYSASKAGLIGLTRSLALEIASRNVTVNAVAPGLIDTDMTSALSEAARKQILDRVPLKRPGTACDVAAAVRFLASEEAGYITGHVLDVNGGMYM